MRRPKLPHEARVTQPMNRPVGQEHAAGVQIAGMTDLGRHRKRNEDAIDWDARLGLAMVADGMGGNQGGDVASVTALRSIRNDLRRALAETHRHAERAHSREARASLVVELVRRAGFRSARTIEPGWVEPGTDPYRVTIVPMPDTASPSRALSQIAAVTFARTLLSRRRRTTP